MTKKKKEEKRSFIPFLFFFFFVYFICASPFLSLPITENFSISFHERVWVARWWKKKEKPNFKDLCGFRFPSIKFYPIFSQMKSFPSTNWLFSCVTNSQSFSSAFSFLNFPFLKFHNSKALSNILWPNDRVRRMRLFPSLPFSLFMPFNSFFSLFFHSLVGTR